MKHRIILITGAGSGFGLLMAERFRRNYTVLAAVKKKEDTVKLKKYGLDFVYEMDITDESARKNMLAEIEQKFGKIDVLVNNAGFCQGGVAEALSEADWEEQMNVNVVGTAALTKEALPLLKRGREAKIIQMGSISGRIGFPGIGAYAASKFALRGLSHSLRLELLPKGIHVVHMEIGSFKTPIWNKSRTRARFYNGNDYKKLEESLEQHTEKTASSGDKPVKVINKIESVIHKKKPAFNYRTGKGVIFLTACETFLPHRAFEKIIIRQTGGKI
ncbi:SDR family NAD(P)-dependent oxidoreductase [Alkalicoccus halolimnae]|uniref:SDR family NAD(P)-dependent oxidoreductase n=1 Tax=Alkalicoccus halolimnae TaxID=1667239 RepID=A0AAJ8LTI3_9BACI|nr:SDR family NAD(P)-dependent oxidoreductase [Alkalicoccus halolimnae]